VSKFTPEMFYEIDSWAEFSSLSLAVFV
jgi:hypothetical protein